MTHPRATITSAEATLVRHLLTGPGVQSVTDHFLIDGELYSIRIEAVTDENRIQEIVDECVS